MTSISEILSVPGTIGQSAGALARGIGQISSLFDGGSSGTAWYKRLQPASYRGHTFHVLTAEGEFGRRNAVHEYPYRDTVWVEDLGRRRRQFNITGFLVGDNVMYLRDQIISDCEKGNSGQFVHPSIGTLNVSVLELRTTERFDRGRYIELQFSFIESGQRVFPFTTVSTGSAVLAAAAKADQGSLSDFVTKAESALKEGSTVVQQVVGTVAVWARTAQRLVNDATNITNMLSTLSGNFGRYFNGRNAGGFSGILQNTQSASNSINGLTNLASAARANVNFAMQNLTSVGSSLGLL